ncbi:pre-peptidase C-terminal domain-containing protein [Fontivita pretiosa]|uniref:pre-peptidase C-terminal domain-containing protein n=1 Tax=Fontivita pretiosa TaxID=2989684 RepID=UPI003D182679
MKLRTHQASYCAEPLEPRTLLAEITSGQMISDSLPTPGASDTYSFTANAKESVSLVVGATGGINFLPYVQVFAPNGVALNAINSNSFDAENLLQSGTYTAVVRDVGNDHTGTYNLSFFRAPATQLVDADSRPTVSNQRNIGSIDRGDIDVYTFSANAGDSISIDTAALNGVNFLPRLRLFAPNGVALTGFVDAAYPTQLPQTGTYCVTVRDAGDDHVGSYAFTMIRMPETPLPDADSGPVFSNQRRIGAIEPGDLDVYTVDANAGDAIAVDVGAISGTNFLPVVRVFAPNGSPLTDFVGSASLDQLAQTGTYSIAVYDYGSDHVGTYGFTVLRMPATPLTTVADADSGPTLSNQRQIGTIDPGDLDVFTFEAGAGDSIGIDVGSLGGVNFLPLIRVFAPNGLPMSGFVGSFEGVQMPLTGTYYVAVHDNGNDHTGTYALTMLRFPAEPVFDTESGTILSNQRRVGAIDSGDLDVFTFHANAGDSVAIDVGAASGVNFLPLIRVYAPNGLPMDAFAGSAAFDQLPQTGTYSIAVHDNGDDHTGTYGITMVRATTASASVQLIDADSGPILSNQRRSGVIDSGDLDVYTFDADAGDSIALNVGGTGGVNFLPLMRVFAPNGLPLSGYISSFDASNLAQGGTYTVAVHDNGNDHTGSYGISLARMPSTQTADPSDLDGGAIASGQTRSGSLNAGDLDVYTINLTQGANVTIRAGVLAGVNFLPRILLYAPNGVLLANQTGNPATITFTNAPVTGTYYVLVRDNGDDHVGSYSLSIDTPLVSDTTPPQMLFARYNAQAAAAQVLVGMSESLGATLAVTDLTVQNLTAGTNIPTANLTATFNASSNEIVIGFPGYATPRLPEGNYRVTILAGSVADAAGNSPTIPLSLDFFFMNADVNQDRRVDGKDLYRLNSNWQGRAATFAQGDLDLNGVVDQADLDILIGKWQQVLPAPPPGQPLAASPLRRQPIVNTVFFIPDPTEVGQLSGTTTEQLQ